MAILQQLAILVAEERLPSPVGGGDTAPTVDKARTTDFPS
jgi:hypothetical protein